MSLNFFVITYYQLDITIISQRIAAQYRKVTKSHNSSQLCTTENQQVTKRSTVPAGDKQAVCQVYMYNVAYTVLHFS